MVREQRRLRLRAARLEALSRKVGAIADAVRTERAVYGKPVVRGYAETRHNAKSWSRERCAVARIEATTLGLDIRFVVTTLEHGAPEWIYDSLYCARGLAENLIKLHKTQLASDRTSRRSAVANQVRLVLHTAAYWLMLTFRDAIPKARDSAQAEFATLRLRLIKIASRISRVRLAFAACCPEADLFCGLPGALAPLAPSPRRGLTDDGAVAPSPVHSLQRVINTIDPQAAKDTNDVARQNSSNREIDRKRPSS